MRERSGIDAASLPGAEERALLRDSLRGFLAEHWPAEQAIARGREPEAIARVWSGLAEQGLAGLGSEPAGAGAVLGLSDSQSVIRAAHQWCVGSTESIGPCTCVGISRDRHNVSLHSTTSASGAGVASVDHSTCTIGATGVWSVVSPAAWKAASSWSPVGASGSAVSGPIAGTTVCRQRASRSRFASCATVPKALVVKPIRWTRPRALAGDPFGTAWTSMR